MEGRLDDLRVMFFSKVFQSYQDDGKGIMKGCVQWNPNLPLERFPPPLGIEPRSTRSAGNGLTTELLRLLFPFRVDPNWEVWRREISTTERERERADHYSWVQWLEITSLLLKNMKIQ